MHHPRIFVKAFINHLEDWHPKNDKSKQNFLSFASFLRRLLQVFNYLGLKADLQSSTLMKKAKDKFLYNILLKWTDYTIISLGSQPTLSDFKKWLEVQEQIHDKIKRESVHKPFNSLNTCRQNKNNINRTNNNTHNGNNNAMNIFLVIQQTIGNKIQCSQVALYTSMVHRPFRLLKMLIIETILSRNAKEVTYSLRASNF